MTWRIRNTWRETAASLKTWNRGSLKNGLENYMRHKVYNSEFGDIAPHVIISALGLNIEIVYRNGKRFNSLRVVCDRSQKLWYECRTLNIGTFKTKWCSTDNRECHRRETKLCEHKFLGYQWTNWGQALRTRRISSKIRSHTTERIVDLQRRKCTHFMDLNIISRCHINTNIQTQFRWNRRIYKIYSCWQSRYQRT